MASGVASELKSTLRAPLVMASWCVHASVVQAVQQGLKPAVYLSTCMLMVAGVEGGCCA